MIYLESILNIISKIKTQLESQGQVATFENYIAYFFGNQGVEIKIIASYSLLFVSFAIWAASVIALVIAFMIYIPLLCQIQGNLKEYCVHKIDKRLSQLFERLSRKKREKARRLEMEHAERNRLLFQQENGASEMTLNGSETGSFRSKKALPPIGLKDAPTLPNMDVDLNSAPVPRAYGQQPSSFVNASAFGYGYNNESVVASRVDDFDDSLSDMSSVAPSSSVSAQRPYYNNQGQYAHMVPPVPYQYIQYQYQLAQQQRDAQRGSMEEDRHRITQLYMNQQMRQSPAPIVMPIPVRTTPVIQNLSQQVETSNVVDIESLVNKAEIAEVVEEEEEIIDLKAETENESETPR